MPAAAAGCAVPRDKVLVGFAGQALMDGSARCVTGSPTGFMPRGIGVGDRVALMMGNAPRMLALWVGALRAGGIVVTLDTARRAERLAHLLEDSKPDLVLDDEFTAQLEDMADVIVPPETINHSGVELFEFPAARPERHALVGAASACAIAFASVDEICRALRRLSRAGLAILLVEQYVQRAIALPGCGRIAFAGAAAAVDRDDVAREYLGVDINQTGAASSADTGRRIARAVSVVSTSAPVVAIATGQTSDPHSWTSARCERYAGPRVRRRNSAATAWPRSVFRSAPRRSACAGMHHRFREAQSNSSRSGAGVTLAPGDENRSIR
jgi:hypothetical protein